MSITPDDEISFRDRVLHVVRKIPRGETRSYKEVAIAAGAPGAARAVGTIMKHNRLPDVPCHRVVRSDGTIGDYNRGGASEKRRLLKREGAVG